AYFAQKSFIRENQDLIGRFTNAVAKGLVWVKDHSAAEVAEVIAPSFPDTDLETLTDVVENYKQIDAWCASPVMKEESFDRLQMVMTEAGELSQKAPFDEIVDNFFAEKAK
ncbi:MAG: ABC transporter substrate-binding protein, partial [Oscillospiraceae bacterium]|nr:ABC transporter substrate-binding protein [Oscillospiraceae bacterium]